MTPKHAVWPAPARDGADAAEQINASLMQQQGPPLLCSRILLGSQRNPTLYDQTNSSSVTAQPSHHPANAGVTHLLRARLGQSVRVEGNDVPAAVGHGVDGLVEGGVLGD